MSWSDGGFENELADLLPDRVEEDSEPPESAHDKALRWLNELVLNVKLTDDQVIEVAKVYTLQDIREEIIAERMSR